MSSLHSPSTTRRSAPSRRGRAGLATAAVLLTVAPLATACGAGFNSASTQVKPNSGSGSTGALKVNNVWVVVDPSSGNAEVIGAVANSGSTDVSWPDVQVDGAPARIVPASASGAAGGSSSSSSAGSVSAGSVSAATSSATGIPAGESVQFGQPGQPQVELPGSALTVGQLTQVTFSFGGSGSVTVTAQIQSNTGAFAEYNPNPASPSPSPSASVSASASATTSPGASAGAASSASASASASPSSTR